MSRSVLVQQRSEVFSQIATNNREIAQIAIELKPTPILAPISGTIQDLKLRNNAQVVQVSADAKSIDKNAGNNSSGQAPTAANGVYEVTINPDTLSLDRGGTKCDIRSGMDGRVDIISQEETVLAFMLKKARLVVTNN